MNKKGNVCFVEPIRDKKLIEDMKKHLKINNIRDWLLFTLGINSGLRIGDLLRLNVEDVLSGEVVIREKKTGKTKKFVLSHTCRQAIGEYLETTGRTTGVLFPSRKDNSQAITTVQAWRIIKEAAAFVGIPGNIGSHTMRKTFGYWALRQGADISFVMTALNHSNPAVTKRYIGITADELDTEIYSKMNL